MAEAGSMAMQGTFTGLARRPRSAPIAFLLCALGLILLAAPANASVPVAEAKALAADQEIGFGKAERALERQSHAPSLGKSARDELGSAFGGVWIDNEDGATVKLGVDGPPGALADGIGAAAGSGTGAEVVKVEHSYAELEAAARWLSARLLNRDTDLGDYFTSGIRTDRNAVFLGVPADRPLGPDQKQFLAEAKSRFGSMLLLDYYEGELAHRSCSWPYCDPPLRGGNRLLREGKAGLEGHCTGGFVTRGRGPNHDLFLLTAGHCALGLGSGTLWSIPPAPIGSFHNFINGGSGDAGIIKVNNEGYWKARSWVYVKGGNGIGANDQYPIYDDADPIVGMHVCTNGGFSFALSKKSWCGYVTDVNTTFAWTKNMVRTSVCTEYGDSGGPLFANNTAYGVLSGGPSNNFCDSYFMEIQPAEDLMNVDVTHAPKPPSPPKPPVAVTTSAASVSATQVTLQGTVNPQGSATQYYFEYGTSTGYGSIKPIPDGNAGSGLSALAFDTVANGLKPDRTYHYRIVGSSEGGMGYGADKTFKTPKQFDFSGDGKADVLARKPDGTLWLYRGSGNGGFVDGGQQIGVGWQYFNSILSPGDFSGDGNADVLARKPDGTMILYRGSGNGGFTESGQGIGSGWNNFSAVLSPGDFSGDGNPDLLARTPDGAMLLYRGNGQSGWAANGQQIGSGWNSFNAILSPGDFTGDGNSDVLARTPDGALFLYRGNGQSGWAANGEQIGIGWNYFNAIFSNGDFSGDGKADVLARKPDGTLWLYRGSGNGGFVDGGQQIGVGWQYFNSILDAGAPIGTDTIGIFDSSIGHWCLSNRTTSGTATCDVYHAVLGGSADQAIAGDWNGDGISTPGVFNPSVGHWCLSNRTTSGDPECDLYLMLGSSGDQAVAGDWNGDGIDTLGVFNQSAGQWCLSNRTTSGTATCDIYISLGGSGNKAVAGDWNGDGIDTLGVFAPSIGHWCLTNRATSGTATCDIYHAVLGDSITIPIAGDWDRDGADTPGVFTPSIGHWCLTNRTTSGDPECDLYEVLGPGGKPVVGDWDGS